VFPLKTLLCVSCKLGSSILYQKRTRGFGIILLNKFSVIFVCVIKKINFFYIIVVIEKDKYCLLRFFLNKTKWNYINTKGVSSRTRRANKKPPNSYKVKSSVVKNSTTKKQKGEKITKRLQNNAHTR